MEWRAGMEWDEFVEERRDDAIEALLVRDSTAIVDEVVNYLWERNENGEHAVDIMAVALTAYLARNDVTISPERVQKLDRFFENTLLEAPFFEDLIKYKLNEMWDMRL